MFSFSSFTLRQIEIFVNSTAIAMQRSGEKGYSHRDNSTRTFKRIKYLQCAFIITSKYTELLI